jgi:ABC-type dipeptide/oligopeptide/nickel transport system ATPase component
VTERGCPGWVVEHGRTRNVFTDPQHEYTRKLPEAVPGIRRVRTESVA